MSKVLRYSCVFKFKNTARPVKFVNQNTCDTKMFAFSRSQHVKKTKFCAKADSLLRNSIITLSHVCLIATGISKITLPKIFRGNLQSSDF